MEELLLKILENIKRQPGDVQAYEDLYHMCLEAAGYNYSEVQSKVNVLAGVAPAPAPQRKSVDEIAREVIAG